MAGLRRKKSWSPYCRIIPVRCLGSVNAIWVADAMSKGYDGVLLLGCKYGDDYQCHFVKGDLRNMQPSRGQHCGYPQEMVMEPERVEQMEVAIDEYDSVPDRINDFMWPESRP